jgi:mitogen-activated protein kinase organizer 1
MQLLQTIQCGQGAIRAVRFNKDGNYCITCGADKAVVLWNPYKKLKLQTYSGHSQEVLDADCSHDHSFLCTASADKTCFYFDVSTGKILRKFRGHAGRVQCVRFNLVDSNMLISGSIDGKVKLWDLRARSFEPVQDLEDFKDSVTYIDLNNEQILVSCLDKHLRLYDIRYGKLYCDYIGQPITCSRLTKDNQCMLISTLNDQIFLFDKFNGNLLNEYKGHLNKTYQLENCMNNDISEIYSGSEDGCIFVWDLVSSSVKYKLKHLNERTVHSLSYHPTDKKLLSAQEQYVYLWTENDT